MPRARTGAVPTKRGARASLLLHAADDRDVESSVSVGRRRWLARSASRVESAPADPPRLEARILNWTRKLPTDGTTHWSTRRLGEKLQVPRTIVARAWKRAGLQPHRLERYLRSTDPKFEEKVAEIIGLYLDPPQHAAVFCVDKKAAIQALDGRDPILPLSPGRAERHGYEYVLHGTLSLYAALETRPAR